MDPKQALIDADQAVSDMEYGVAVDRLHAYAIWRFRGGFEPTDDGILGETKGDRIFDRLMDKLCDRLSLAEVQ